jgi:hypothetical protein
MTSLYDKVTIPSKYDIIPIHTSDVANFLRCRRYWNWSSPARSNLRHRVEQYGINTNLWFGSGIHFALESYYNPLLQRSPVEAFQTWFEYQWNGGIVTPDWLDRTYDIKPEAYASHPDYGVTLWKIRGLKDLHPDPRHEEFEELRQLGIGMMEFYKGWAPKHDNFEVVAAEALFSVPVITNDRRILTSVDTREESPNFGKRLEVHARGKRDTIIYDPENDQYGLIDYKTASKIDEDYFLKLENDAQVSNYMWASQMEARMFSLPWRTISFCIYQAMWKQYPHEVITLADGLRPSLDRSKQSCTAEMFADHIANTGLQAWYDDDVKAQAFYNYLVAEADTRFINRERAYRSQIALRTTGEELAMIAEEMLAENLKIYKRPSGDRNCTRCVFRAPCLAMDDGADWPSMIEAGYEQNRDR